MDYNTVGSGGAYDENPEDPGALVETTPQASGIEALMALIQAAQQPLNLPMLPPSAPAPREAY